MERGPKIVGSCVNLCFKLNKDLNHWRMPLTCRQMKRSEAIWVSAVYDLKHLIVLVELLLCITQNLIHLAGISLVYLGPVVHFYLFDILFALLLLRRLLGDTGWAHARLTLGSDRLMSSILLGIASAVSCELICLLIIVVSKVNFGGVLHMRRLLLLLGLA